MKKLFFLSILALGFTFTACEDLETNHGKPQENPQESIFDAKNMTVTATSEAAGVVDLTAYENSGELIPLGTVNVTEGWPEAYGYAAVMQINGKGEINATVDGNTIYADPAEIYAVIYNEITKNPEQASFTLSYAVYGVNGDARVRIGTVDTYFGNYQVKMQPFAPDRIIAPEYYFVYSADGENWSKDNAIKLDHSSTNQYDDPVFSIAYDFPETIIGNFWKIVAADELDNIAAGGYGVSEDDLANEEGKLLAADYTPGMFFLSGQCLLTFNMMDLTFSFKIAIPNFWTPGGANGWSFPRPTLTTSDYVNYYGYAQLSGEFKFSPSAGWNGGDFGCADGLTSVEKDGGIVATGKAEGSTNIKVPADGFYYITLNYPTRALTLYQVNTLGIIGGFNGWGATEAMTPNADYTVWTITQEFSAAGDFKFRANSNWDINLGGDLNNLVPGGANIPNEAGTYEITLNLGSFPYTATMVKK